MVDQSRLIIHFALMTPLGVLSTVLVALRFYTRLCITKMRLAADDYLIFVAMAISNASAIMVGVADFAFDEGQTLGNSRSDIYKKVGMRKIHWIATQIYPIMSFSLKISILLLYRRIFFVVPAFTRVCNILIIVITVMHLAGFTSGIFLCMPISYFWQQAIPPGYPGAPTHQGRCQNYQVAWLVLGSFNVLTDLVAVVLPLPVLGRLRITAARRASLIFIFALSSVTVIASLLRIRPLARIPGGNDDPLFSQHVWELQLYCGIEMSVGIICACLPTLSPLAIRVFPKLMASLGGAVPESIDRAPASGLGGLGWRALKGRKASDDAAIDADAGDRGFAENFNAITTIGGTSAKFGRKGSMAKGRLGRKHSDATAYSDIATIMTEDGSMETKVPATVVLRELDHDVEDQIPRSPRDKIGLREDKTPSEKAQEHSKKKNALGLHLWEKDHNPWTSTMANALTPKQHKPQQHQRSSANGGDAENWRLSPFPLPSPSFNFSMMLSPKTTTTTTTEAVWSARMSEVIAVPVVPPAKQANNLEEDNGAAKAQTMAETEIDDRSRQRTRPPASSQRRRSSRSLDWQAASGTRNHARNAADEYDVDAADRDRRDSGATVWQWTPSRGSPQVSDDARVGFDFALESSYAQKLPLPHPLHAHPLESQFPSSHQQQNQPHPFSAAPPSPTHSLPSPSIYSRASVFTLPFRRQSAADTLDHGPSHSSYHQHHHHHRPSTGEAYATIVEDDGEAGQTQQGWTTATTTTEEPRKASDATSVTLVHEEDADEWANAEGEARSVTAAAQGDWEREGGRGSGIGLRRRPVSWTAEWRRM